MPRHPEAGRENMAVPQQEKLWMSKDLQSGGWLHPAAGVASLTVRTFAPNKAVKELCPQLILNSFCELFSSCKSTRTARLGATASSGIQDGSIA